jgi:hypothetical protein
MSPPPHKKTANARYEVLAVVSLKSQVFQDVTLCEWLCGNFKGTLCLELWDQAVIETLPDLEDEYTVLLHNIGTIHPMTRSHPKRN